MCLALPAKLLEVCGEEGQIELGGTRKTVILSLIEHARPGQYVLVHAGYAIEVVDEAEALELAALQRTILEFGEKSS